MGVDMTGMNEDTLEQTTVEYLEQQLGWGLV